MARRARADAETCSTRAQAFDGADVMSVFSLSAVRRELEQSAQVKRDFDDALCQRILMVAQSMTDCLLSGGKVLLFGNGGSAADAQHIAAELVGRFRREREPLRAMALTANSSVMTSVANDYDYAQVFSRQ